MSEVDILKKAALLMAEDLRKRLPQYEKFPLSLIVQIYLKKADDEINGVK